jgi:hypothetical protein
MKRLVVLALKSACVVLYVLALASLAGLVQGGSFQRTAAIILTLHVLEVGFAFKQIRLYRGPLWVSVVLTLLFGVLHWKPLADERAREQAGPHPSA